MDSTGMFYEKLGDGILEKDGIKLIDRCSLMKILYEGFGYILRYEFLAVIVFFRGTGKHQILYLVVI
jgi:hypothetical protein